MLRLHVALAFSASLGAVGCASNPTPLPAQAPAPAPVQPVAPEAANKPDAPERAWSSVVIDPIEVSFPSGANTLHGILVKPPGDGPFPTLVWNHGSEEKPELPRRLAKFWIAQGFVFFVPFRRGHGSSGGTYFGIARQDVQIWDRSRWEVAELERQVDDVLAATTYLRTQRFVDAERMVVAGGSFGGIETLLVAERGGGFKAGLDFAGGAMSWEHSSELQDRLRRAVKLAKIPLFFIQAENDYSTEPTRVLSEEAAKNNKPYRAKIYPPNGDDHRAGHLLCVTRPDVWGADVLAFLKPIVR